MKKTLTDQIKVKRKIILREKREEEQNLKKKTVMKRTFVMNKKCIFFSDYILFDQNIL